MSISESLEEGFYKGISEILPSVYLNPKPIDDVSTSKNLGFLHLLKNTFLNVMLRVPNIALLLPQCTLNTTPI